MSEMIKLGLTRNRLFEFDNCVTFFGETEEPFDISECEKALKMLCIKEPILTGVVELREKAEAYIVTNKNEPSLEITEGDLSELICKKKTEGINFDKELFSFAIINKKILGIFAHTVVADSRSLMHLADEFMSFYNKRTLSVEPCAIKVLSETNQLPSNVFSVVVDRLASGLEVGWQKRTAEFTVEDYKKAREKYFKTKASTKTVSTTIPEELFDNLKAFAQKEKTDISSLVAFSFYESLVHFLGGKRRYRKLNVQADERIFFEDFNEMRVGAFNGFFAVEKKKNKKLPDTLGNNAVNFHKEIYKRATSSFSVFYNEFLFMRLPASFCDSQYMFCAGEFKHKYSEKLANTYGCANEVLGEVCSFNLNQNFWSGLDCFNRVVPGEPLKMRSSSMITFVQSGEKNEIYFEYKTDKISDSVAQSVIENALRILEDLK